MRELVGRVREELNKEEVNENDLKELINEVLKLRADLRELDVQSEKLAQETLTLKQQAKFMVFLQDFQKQMRNLLQQVKGLRQRQGMPERFRDDERRPAPPRERQRRFNPPPEDFPPEFEY